MRLLLDTRHTSLLTTMPMHHKDPFDRLLIAQALVEQIAVVSADAAFDTYGVRQKGNYQKTGIAVS